MKRFLLYALLVPVVLLALAALFFVTRQAVTATLIEKEWKTDPGLAPVLETTSRLEIIPLYENDRVEERYELGHGISYLIRTDSATVLLDLGHNPAESVDLPAIQNLQALGLPWEEIDALVVSHPHPDHMGGVKAWQNKTISFGDLTGDLSGMPIYVPASLTYPGATLIQSTEPVLVSREVATTGLISYPEVFPISLFTSRGAEQGLIVDVAGEGLVLITGCGHPTLETLVARAEALYGKEVVGVVGGLHYGEADAAELEPHIQFLETRHPRLIALSPHDSSPAVLEGFHSKFPEAFRYIRVGETILFP